MSKQNVSVNSILSNVPESSGTFWYKRQNPVTGKYTDEVVGPNLPGDMLFAYECDESATELTKIASRFELKSKNSSKDKNGKVLYKVVLGDLKS